MEKASDSAVVNVTDGCNLGSHGSSSSSVALHSRPHFSISSILGLDHGPHGHHLAREITNALVSSGDEEAAHHNTQDEDIEEGIEEEDEDVETDDEILRRYDDPTSLSAFVRPTPLRAGESGPQGGTMEGAVPCGENSAVLPPQLTSPLTGGPFAPLWYPPWMTAFKPVFGLQGKLVFVSKCCTVKQF